MTRTRLLPLGAGALLIAVGAGTGAAAGTDAPDYCAAHLAAEAAFNSEDPDAIGPAVEALFEAAPEDLLPTVQTMIDNVPDFGPPTAEFVASYTEVATWVNDNCGFASLQVLAQDYSFGGLPAELTSGPTVIELINEGTEVHEILLLKRADGFDAPVEEVLAMLAEDEGGPPEEDGPEGDEGEMGEPPISFVGVAYAFPGESGFGVFDLTPGEYIALCFIPVGTTPEVFAELMEMFAAMEEMGDETGPPMDMEMEEGAPHFTEGMIAEFTVTD